MGALDVIDSATCIYVPFHDGAQAVAADQLVATVFNIAIAVISVVSLLFYAYHARSMTCGWEEVYVVCIELIKVMLEIFFEACPPVTLIAPDGVSHIVWIRYVEWALTCPVLLIHLSNLTGLSDDYNTRTMALLVSDIGTILMGVTAAFSSGWIKVVFFLLGLLYGSFTFKHAAMIHMEAFYSMPRGPCRSLVKWMAAAFFISWGSYPILFLLGQEGFFAVLTPWGSVAAHAVADVLSKNLWGFLGHTLRIKIHEHISEHGLIRARRKHQLLGGLMELEVETLVSDESEDGAVRSSVAGLTNRKSFQQIRANLVKHGRNVRSASDEDHAAAFGPRRSVELLGETSSTQLNGLGNAAWATNMRPSMRGRVQPAGSRLSVDVPPAANGKAAGKQGSGEEAAVPPGDGEGGHGSVLVRTEASMH